MLLIEKSWWAIFIVLLACGKGNGGTDVVDLAKPVFVAATITNGAEDVAAGEQTIVLTYDQNVTLPNAAGITLNGETVGKASAAFKELRVVVDLQRATSYTLIVPANSIKGPGGLGADEVQLSFRTKGTIDTEIATALVTQNPSAQAKNVYDFLRSSFGEKVLSGAMANVNWNTHEAEWVHQHTGKYPALNCFDFIHLYASPVNWIDYSNTQVVENWWNAGGVVAAMWHWNVPKSSGNLDYAFYTQETNFDVSQAIINGTAENAIIQADLEKIADYLLLLKAKNIPVIWRPLHEAAGKWFWWGAKGADSYRALWRLMFNTFKDKGLNNLIWVWTSETEDEAWYPGDEYVDIIGCDLYNKTTATDVIAVFDNIRETYPSKILALSEFGNAAALQAQWSGGATWSWVMPWYDYERTASTTGSAFQQQTHQHADIAYWKAMLASDKVITRDEVPNLK